MKNNVKEFAALGLVLIIASFMMFYSLDDAYLWQDEAQTALISKTVLQTGVPHAYDGNNYFFQDRADAADNNLVWRWHPWLPFYVTAASYKIFGINTFSARLPFVIFGILTVLLMYFLALELWRSKSAAMVCALLLALCVPFILLSRQCRYYSMAVFFFTLAIYGYMLILNSKKYGAAVFTSALILLFHTQYIYLPVLAASVLVHSLLLDRKKTLKVALYLALAAVVCLPFYLLLYRSDFLGGYDYLLKAPVKRFFAYLNYYLKQTGSLFLHPALIVIAVYVIFKNKNKAKEYFKLNNTLFTNALLLVLISVFMILQFSISGKVQVMRYLAPAFPCMLLLLGYLLHAAYRQNRFLGLGYAVFILLGWNTGEYMLELQKPFTGPLECVSKYLDEHAGKSDILAVGGYGDLPLKFYTGMKVIGGECGQEMRLLNRAKWIFIRANTVYFQDERVKKYMLENINLKDYEKIPLPCVDTKFENREMQPEHYFMTQAAGETVSLLRKK